MIRTTPFRRITRQYSQMGFTLVRTFTPEFPFRSCPSAKEQALQWGTA